ncbi:hypothetical protein AAG906_039329 [Vitis piasezkii]
MFGNGMLYFLDAFFGYHQIPMFYPNQEKTTFITPYELYCYNVMPFGLKNAGITYQKLMIKIFKPLMGRTVEVYIDDIIEECKSVFDAINTVLFQQATENGQKPIYYVRTSSYNLDKSTIKGHLAQATSIWMDDEVDFITELPRKQVQIDTTNHWWIQHVDKASRTLRIEQSVHLDFPASNNEAKYEVMIVGLELALILTTSKVEIRSDFQLVACYLNSVEARLAKMVN